MAFNQLLDNLKRSFNIPLAIQIAKLTAYIAGTIVIFATIISLFNGNWEFILSLVKLGFPAINSIISFAIPRFVELILASLTCLWLPIVLYIGISIITVSQWGRFYLCLATLCGFVLTIETAVFSNISLSSIFEILIYLMQIYLLLLWTVPREVWNFIGGAFFLLQGIIVLVIPDLPGYFDDFGFITAIFSFIFLYLHTTASLVQRFVDTQLIAAMRNYFNRFTDQKLPED